MPKPKKPENENSAAAKKKNTKTPATPAPPEAESSLVNLHNSADIESVYAEDSGLSEAEQFEKFVEDEERQSQIDAGLSEIYHDENGNVFDVKTMEMKKGHGPVFLFFRSVGVLAVLAFIGWFGYRFYLAKQAEQPSSVQLVIAGESEVLAGKEVTYAINYKNLDQIAMENLNIDVKLPDNFILSSTEPAGNIATTTWKVDRLDSKRSDQIIIKGRLLGEVGQNAIVLANMTYKPENFSSNFTREASFNTKVTGLGLDLTFDYPSTALLGDEVIASIKYKAQEENYLNGFRISIDPIDNVEFLNNAAATGTAGSSWQIAQASTTEQVQDIRLRFKTKASEKQDVLLVFDYTIDGQKYYTFLKKPMTFEVVDRNLNLNLIMNGSQKDQGVDFGQTLNYSITYANKGETNMKDIVIMANLESDFLDWPTLSDKSNGQVGNGKITWNKDQIPGLADLAPGNEGVIDFTIKVAPAGEIDPAKNYQIKSFARFS
ncbi:hypothetical protein HGA64_04435, partial [Candidatus Falkowbacteria bacterium]|nr:hypothetical protein [Candidatus Falkowbacteria bacterium]